MSTDKPDEKPSNCKLYHNNQPIVVSPYVEYIMLIAHIIGIRKIHPYVRETPPFGIFHNLIPPLKGNSGVFPSFGFVEFLQLTMRYDSHLSVVSETVANLIQNFEIHKYSTK